MTGQKTTVSNASKVWRGDLTGGKDSRSAAGSTTRGRRTRERLLEAGREIFERDGFLRARIVDICDLARTSHGSFYTYFGSKEEIFREVVDSVEVYLLTMKVVPPNADPIERIRVANRHYLEAQRDNARILEVIDQVATFDPEVRATVDLRQNELAAVLERRIRQLQETGNADGRLEPAYAASALGGMVADFAKRLFTDPLYKGRDLDTSVEQLTILWSNALGLGQAGRRPRAARSEGPTTSRSPVPGSRRKARSNGAA